MISSKDLTAFIFTNGRSTFQYAMKSVEEQNSKLFDIKVISDKTMINAIRYALSICKTKYFLKIDDDFMLHPRAVSFIEYFINSRNLKNIGLYWWHLWENWSNKRVQSIKVYPTHIAQKLGFLADREGRIDLIFLRKLRGKKLRIISDGSCLALHSCAPWEEQKKYFDLWKNNSNKHIHRKLGVDFMKSFSVPVKDQFDGRIEVLEKANTRFITTFTKYLR